MARVIESATQLVEVIRDLYALGAYQEALVTASVWAPHFAGDFTPPQQAELTELLAVAETHLTIIQSTPTRVELDPADLAVLEQALDEADPRPARPVIDRFRRELGLPPRTWPVGKVGNA